MYLLDTNICIYLMKGTFSQLQTRFFTHSPADMFISSVSIFELEYGAAKSHWGERTRQALALFLAPFPILPFDTDDAIIAGSIRATLEKQGQPIGPYDVQIAAQAVTKGLTLVTHNADEFQRVPQLQWEDWIY